MFGGLLNRVRSVLQTTKRGSVQPSKLKPEEKNRVSISKTKPVKMVQVKVDKKRVAGLLKERERINRVLLDLKSKERGISQRLYALNEKEKYLLEKEKKLDNLVIETNKKKESIDDLYRKQLEKLEQIADLDVSKAKKLIISSTERKLSSWIAKKIEECQEQIKQKEEELSREILLDSLRHGVSNYVPEYTVSTVTLVDEKIKGKIIGREGRNIRAFEQATGVELDLDEGNDVKISSFDSTRREIARVALERLMKDGRIQPIKIERIVAETKNDMEKILLNEGKKICQEVGVFNLPIDLIRMVGKFKFRFSYGQNLALHTIEATKIASAIARELGADLRIVKLGALLHDIGKVISDQEGTHVELGIDFLKGHRLSEAVINCVAEHHEDKKFSSVESIIVYIGDAVSGARPGARYAAHEEYLKRMKNIEEIAKSFNGVKSVAAYQAGREVIVIVDPEKISDDEITILSQNIAEKLDEEAKWAGQIKVTVIRESRASNIVVGSKINKNAVKSVN